MLGVAANPELNPLRLHGREDLMISAVLGTFCILALKQMLQHNPVFSCVNPAVNREPLFCLTLP